MSLEKKHFLKHKNPFIRKSAALCFQFYKHTGLKKNSRPSPPVLVNSFPKSGTHLLNQIMASLPGIRDFGTFIASMPSVRYREKPHQDLCRTITYLVDHELASGHLFHARPIKQALQKRKVIHFFIHRDPRDVCISEAYYLTHMNRWHRLHRYYRKLPAASQRILLAITGGASFDCPLDYPDISERFAKYEGWLKEPDVFSLKYEDLVSAGKKRTIYRIIQFYRDHTNRDHTSRDHENIIMDIDKAVSNALAAIDPEKSHTFRRGTINAWKQEFNKNHKSIFKDKAGDLLIRLGYEKDYDW